MWGPPFFFSCTILLRSSLKTRSRECTRVIFDVSQKMSKSNLPYARLCALTEDVGFDGEGEVRVVSQDVDGFAEGNILKVLTVDLHDLKTVEEMTEYYSKAHL